MKKFFARLSTILVLMMVIVSGSALFWVSQKVQQLERQQKSFTAQIAEEKEGIRVLTAEWDYLNRPERLELLAQRYLGMQVVTPDQIIEQANYIPLKSEIDQARQDQSIPISAKLNAGRAASAALAASKSRSKKPAGAVKIYDIQTKPIRENGAATNAQNFNQILETERGAQ